MLNEDFYERTKRLCRKNCMTIEGLMSSCGLIKDTFAKWRRREIYPRADILMQMCQILNVSMEYMMTGEEEYRLNPRVVAIADFLEKNPEKLDAIETILFDKKVGQSSMLG